MSRKIKFRAWCADEQEMCNNPFLGNVNTDADTSDLMQFTGKYDMNGTEIYEGDLLKFDDPTYKAEAHEKPYLVIFDEDTADFDAQNSMNFMNPAVWGHMEIVGNRHENPELMGYTK